MPVRNVKAKKGSPWGASAGRRFLICCVQIRCLLIARIPLNPMHSPPLCAYGNPRSLLQSPVPVTRGTPVYSEPLSSGKYPPGGLVKLRPRGYDTHMRVQSDLIKNRRRNRTALVLLAAAVLILSFVCLFVGSSHMTIAECFSALVKKGSPAQVRIIWNIRIPRVLAAIIAGAGLSVSGLIMQTDLNNPMASPSTLGVSNAAVFGANLSIIAFAGGFLDTGNHLSSYTVGANPYATSLMAFLFSTVSILLILGLCRLRAFQPGVVVLAAQYWGKRDTKSVSSIGAEAFSGCEKLRKLYLPESIKFIDANAFSYCPNLTIYCMENSYVHKYCLATGIRFNLVTSAEEYELD